MTNRSLLARALVSGVFALVGCGGSQASHTPANVRAEPVSLDQWEHTYPEASHALGEWVRSDPAAAHRFFEWDSEHPHRAEAFVTWAATHQEEHLDVFIAAHPGWQHWDYIVEHHRPAAEAMVVWVRHYPHAAEALMRHPSGLHWAGHHLYSTYWHMEHPEEAGHADGGAPATTPPAPSAQPAPAAAAPAH